MQKLLYLNCSHCNKNIIKISGNIKKSYKNFFCDMKCYSEFYRTLPKEINCKFCNKLIKFPGLNIFCNKSCAAKYNNTHKTKGTRISKLELYVKNELIKIYPNLEILFNNKTIINSELDIYIPSLKLAFEINGPSHYKPIYGKAKFLSIQRNDKLKKQKCKKLGIKLIIINSSKQDHFTEKSSQKYLNKISSKIIR